MRLNYPLIFLLIIVLNARGTISDTIAFQIENAIDHYDEPMPFLDISFDLKISDISICKGPDRVYYLTGTSDNNTAVGEGIKVWASRDLKEWNYIARGSGYVWTFDNNGTDWQKEITGSAGKQKRAIEAPNIYYLKNTFWISYTNTNRMRSGLLRSMSGRASGPFVEVLPDGFIANGGNASLFVENDSTVYFIWDNGKVLQMLPDMSGFVSQTPQSLPLSGLNYDQSRGFNLFKFENYYYVTASRVSSGISSRQAGQNNTSISERIDGVVFRSNSLFGEYTHEVLIPHGGSGHLIHDFDNRLRYVFSNYKQRSPLGGLQAFMTLRTDENKRLKIDYKMPFYPGSSNPVVYVSRAGNNSNGSSWSNAYTSIQRAIDNAPRGAQLWISAGTYEGPVDINLREGLYLMGGFRGDETHLWQRNTNDNRVTIHGRGTVRNVVVIRASTYVRLDGITIRGGNARGGSNLQQYGGGLHLLGGGQTIRIVNCIFYDNSADIDGGAIYASVGASPLIINCTFAENSARNNGGAVAVYSNSANGYYTRLYNCIFDNNLALGNGAAVFFSTNKFDSGQLTMKNCLLINNINKGLFGVVSIDGSADFLMVNSTLSTNSGTNGGAVLGKLSTVPGRSRIINTIFHNNNNGSSLFSIEGEAGTSALLPSGNGTNVWVHFSNCIFNQNRVESVVQRNFDGRKWINVSELNQSVMGQSCIDVNPVFANPSEGEFQLSGSSGARGRGSQQFFFGYTIDGRRRSTGSINIGCY